MVSPVNAVIGANYGDEGKGLYTNFFAEIGKNEKSPHLTVRFNGGAQAGHTVLNKQNMKRHVFNHIGSGTFHGADTALDEMFVVNPMIYVNEKQRFSEKHRISYPSIYVHRNCLVTTPYEIVINRIKESNRRANGSQHGSCGVGFGETAKKNVDRSIPSLRIEDCFYTSSIKKKLKEIEEYTFDIELPNYYKPAAFERAGFSESRCLDAFVEDVKSFMKDTIKLDEHGMVNFIKQKASCSSVCFEGAQGLGLDMDQGYFPYVTYSNTGIKNLLKYFKEGLDINLHYITRSYLTRHGAGPVENDKKPLFEVCDTTNVYNEYQESIRSFILDIHEMCIRIYKDISLLDESYKPKSYMHMTHGQHTNNILYQRIEHGQIISGQFKNPNKEFTSISYDEITNPLEWSLK